MSGLEAGIRIVVYMAVPPAPGLIRGTRDACVRKSNREPAILYRRDSARG
jgi:hypothetical protein